jgi:CRP-like cAMP-binding protein
MGQRIRIKARFADQCPLFKAGEGMTVDLPGVVQNRCHNVCAASLNAFLTLYDMRKGKVDGKEYTCSFQNCRATMMVDVGLEFPEVKTIMVSPGASGSSPSKPPGASPAALLGTLNPTSPAARMLAASKPKEEEPGSPPPPPPPEPPKEEAPPPPAEPPAAAPAVAAPAANVAGPTPPPGPMDKGKIVAIAQKLRVAPIFVGLPQEELERLAASVRLISYPVATLLIRAGAPGERYFLLAGGRVEVVQADKDGTEKVLSALGPGEGVGEMSLLTGEACSATVRVIEKVQCLVIERADFERMLNVAPQLNRHFNKILSDRLRAANAKLTDIIDDGVLGKLSMFSLAELAQALTVSSRTGYVHMMHKGQRGMLTVRDGFIFSARLPGAATPEESFLQMMAWREGEFRFERAEVSTLGMRPIDTNRLLMEGMRRADEAKASSPAAPAPAPAAAGSASPPAAG